MYSSALDAYSKVLKRALKEDVKERSGATISQRRRFLEHITGTDLSDSTVRRLMKRLGFTQKNGLWGRWNETSSPEQFGE